MIRIYCCILIESGQLPSKEREQVSTGRVSIADSQGGSGWMRAYNKNTTDRVGGKESCKKQRARERGN